jgi:ankyrin repeat protein
MSNLLDLITTKLDKRGRSEFLNAVIDDNIGLIKRLLEEGVDVNEVDNNGWSALHFASRKSSPEIVKLLLNKNAIVDIKDSNGNTPLFNAVFECRNGNGQIIKLLRAAGADPNNKNNYGISPLELAKQITNYNVKQYFEDMI